MKINWESLTAFIKEFGINPDRYMSRGCSNELEVSVSSRLDNIAIKRSAPVRAGGKFTINFNDEGRLTGEKFATEWVYDVKDNDDYSLLLVKRKKIDETELTF